MTAPRPRPPGSALLPRYRPLLAEADAWFAGAAEAHRESVQCRRGCDLCCRGLFDVTPLDALLLAEGYREAPPGIRRRLLSGARAGLAAIAAAAAILAAAREAGDL